MRPGAPPQSRRYVFTGPGEVSSLVTDPPGTPVTPCGKSSGQAKLRLEHLRKTSKAQVRSFTSLQMFHTHTHTYVYTYTYTYTYVCIIYIYIYIWICMHKYIRTYVLRYVQYIALHLHLHVHLHLRIHVHLP